MSTIRNPGITLNVLCPQISNVVHIKGLVFYILSEVSIIPERKRTFLTSSISEDYSLMAEQLCIASWNATGIMSGASYIRSLLDKRQIHILGLSEHWLFNHNLHFLDSINSNY